jgi:ABC-type transporter Mla subunit MlaD
MPLQDLTPQLRTRLNRMERAVGWFTFLATLLLLIGFGYYIYSTAKQKGWFKLKAPYYTYANNAKGLNVGDPVMLLGFPAGRVLEIEPMPARGEGSEHEVFIAFEITEPYYGYLWTKGSKARLAAADLLGKRELEVTKGEEGGHGTFIQVPVENMSLESLKGLPTLTNFYLGQEIYDGTNLALAPMRLTPEVLQKAEELHATNLWVLDTKKKSRSIGSMWDTYNHRFEPYQKYKNGKLMRYELPQDEQPALTDRAQALLTKIEDALPKILDITNRVNAVLNNTANLTSNLNVIVADARPTVSNLNVITANLKNPKGSLGEWIIPTNINEKLDATLDTTHKTVGDADTNLVTIAESLTKSLDNLANITSNLNNQVEVNSNILTHISDIIVHTDQFVQGLKHHWLLRSAFKTKATNAPASSPKAPSAPLRSPKAQSGE